MDPATMTALALVGTAGSTAMGLANQPALPNIPSPPRQQLTPAPKPRNQSSMQDSFMTGVAGNMGPGNMGGGGKTLLGQ